MIAAPTNGIKMRAIIDAGQVVASLASRILGRFSAEDLVDQNGERHRARPAP